MTNQTKEIRTGDTDASNTVEPPQITLMRFMGDNFIVVQCLGVVSRLGVADLLSRGPRQVEELAEETSTAPDALYRVMRALAGVGIFKEEQDRRFALTPLSEPLVSDIPGSLAAWGRFLGADWYQRIWPALMSTLRNGRPISENESGIGWMELVMKNPEFEREFDQAMVSLSSLSDFPVAEAVSKLGVGEGTIADIGGGGGGQLLAILRTNPGLKGILHDLPPVVEATRRKISEDKHLAARVTFSPGDFFGELPRGCELYMMKSVIHNLADTEAVALFANCRRVMGVGSRLLLADMVLEDNSPVFTKVIDVAMLALSGGRERTIREYEDVLAKAGLRLEGTLQTGTPVRVLVAVAVDK